MRTSGLFLWVADGALRPEIDSVRVGCNLLYDRSHGAGREKKEKKKKRKQWLQVGSCE